MDLFLYYKLLKILTKMHFILFIYFILGVYTIVKIFFLTVMTEMIYVYFSILDYHNDKCHDSYLYRRIY